MEVASGCSRTHRRTGGSLYLLHRRSLLDPKRSKYCLHYTSTWRGDWKMPARVLGIGHGRFALKPYAAEVLVKELRKRSVCRFILHTHDTSGIQSATLLKAIESGVHVVDVALASLSGLTSQPNFNVLAEALRNTPHATNFNIDSLNAFSNYWETVREYYYPFESGLMAGTTEVYKHEIPEASTPT